MEFTISFDMRAPDFGAPAKDLYAAALDQCSWADELGFDFVGIGEHHATDDGYLPSPIVFASAVAARTRRILLRPSVLLAPFYDPLKLAEDLAVLQILSHDRLVVGIGAGYRPAEFEMFATMTSPIPSIRSTVPAHPSPPPSFMLPPIKVDASSVVRPASSLLTTMSAFPLCVVS